MPLVRRPLPPWLAHPLRWQRQPVPWPGVVRGALCAGPLMAVGLATGATAAGVLAALGSTLAGVNDRPGTHRTGLVHIGLPALASALGMFLGALLREGDADWWLVPALFVVGYVSGAGSVAGPVRSNAGMQMLAATVLGAGMPFPLPPWEKALLLLGGGLWLLLLRSLLRPPRPAGGPLSGERAAVATVFDALGDALEAAGSGEAEAARRRLTAALDRADEAVRLHRLFTRRPRRPRPAERHLAERLAAAIALCEASVALLWEAQPLPRRIAEGPREFAWSLRTGEPPGRLAAPDPSTAGRTAFDRSLLDTAIVFARTGPDAPAAEGLVPAVAATPRAGHGQGASPRLPRHTTLRRLVRLVQPRTRRGRGVFGLAGREYGTRVGVCIAVSAAVALLLRPEHWYWLPVTATFLVKPDLGPLFSRTVNRFVGTVLGVLVFGAVEALAGGQWWPACVAGAGGALLPFAVRHFALQTIAITLMVLSFVYVGGSREAAPERVVDTSVACAIVLVVGHLPRLADPRRRIAPRLATGLRRTAAYLRHTLTADPGKGAGRRQELRRAAYAALGEARTAAETAAAELLATRGGGTDWITVVTAAERVVDAVTACAVSLEHGQPRPSAERVRSLWSRPAELADSLERQNQGARRLRKVGVREAAASPLPPVPDSGPLDELAAELGRISGRSEAASP
ncbi:FUSC family protein [Streptomyces sp. NPDC059740]|uniref:FUSC family protein n=1 Tax=Streptomyces sp. NPDC059740 TaxID=3346926 RepID=UPI00364E3FA6